MPGVKSPMKKPVPVNRSWACALKANMNDDKTNKRNVTFTCSSVQTIHVTEHSERRSAADILVTLRMDSEKPRNDSRSGF